MDSGVASGTELCEWNSYTKKQLFQSPESAPINDPTFWVFNIWNPAVSSTTTTTTTPVTTVTVTTKPTSTTSINTLLTTRAGATVSSATTESTVAVMYPKDFELACLQPIALMIALLFAVMMPKQGLALYAIFTKLSNTFNRANISARTRHEKRMTRIMRIQN
ncbi:hypothetical protein I4U23_015958 [Adineta vaga]|nr:hypothetical protein I4U23_015958 [Adineta vaga]